MINNEVASYLGMIILLTTAIAKIVYNNKIDVFKNPKREMEEFIDAVHTVLICLFRLQVDLPFYRLYPNRLYRDTKRGFGVSNARASKF